jgi:hypothetical protein
LTAALGREVGIGAIDAGTCFTPPVVVATRSGIVRHL